LQVDVLSKFRHPNLITLIGVCPEKYSLIYEYPPNGSLRDRLSCKDDTPPLSWQTRISIATELCSALIFLHSGNPHSIVHGDLKAENIFLDAGFVSKLSGFGVSNHPEFLETGELSPKSDIYSFGIIILQLLTGKSRANIVETMPQILDMGNLNALLDPSAGDWPLVQAQQVAHLALRCCDSDPSNRPDLVSEVWRVLKPLSASGGASSSFGMDSEEMDSEEDRQSPSYFICPISHVIKSFSFLLYLIYRD
jgi:serine/threonine protein kinase